MIDEIHIKEMTMINYLNVFYNWKLQHTGMDMEHYDAIGETPKGKKCVMEMKFRSSHYMDMMLEKKKYDWLMEIPDVLKFYLVHDTTGTYIFWLDSLNFNSIIEMNCPETTFWGDDKKQKEIYLLPIQWASIQIIKK